MCIGYYLTKASSNPGAGDVLMGFLGSVILSFAFSMFKQRRVIILFSVDMLKLFFFVYIISIICSRFLIMEENISGIQHEP